MSYEQVSMNINCPHFSSCSGCFLNENVEKNPIFNQAKAFFKEKRESSHSLVENFFYRVGSVCSWRCRAKLAVRGSLKKPLIGLFKEGSHEVVDIPNCKVHHPLINEAIQIVRSWMVTEQIAPYNEATGRGFLRYLELAVDRRKQKIQLVLIVNQKKEEALSLQFQQSLQHLWEQNREKWHSLWLNFNERRDNVILGEAWQRIEGEEWLWDQFCGREICFHPASFSQANPEMFERLLVELNEFVPRGTNLVEFYAGSGVIGLTAAEKASRIRFNEIAPVSEICFENNKKRLPEELRKKLHYASGPVKEHLDLLDTETDLVIVDPPRKGLDPALLEKLCSQTNVKRLIYVSCGWQSFERDCEMLLKNDWKIVHAASFLFFPGTNHIEILAVFDR